MTSPANTLRALIFIVILSLASFCYGRVNIFRRQRPLRLLSASQVAYRIHLVIQQGAIATMEVTTRLAELRTKRGLGAAQLADKIGVSRQTVYAIEAGTYVPN